MLSEISPNVQEMLQMINSPRRDSTTRKRVGEDNLEHAQYHLVMSPKVSTHSIIPQLVISLIWTQRY